VLREEHKVKWFENKMLRIYGLEKEEVTLTKKTLNNFYSSPNIIKVIKSWNKEIQ
jgi:hypothetical protein